VQKRDFLLYRLLSFSHKKRKEDSMKRFKIKCALAGLVSLQLMFALVAGVALADTTFIDQTFNGTNWSATKLWDTSAGGVETFAVSQVTEAGPNDFRQVQHNLVTGTIVVVHIRDGAGFTYDPNTQGAIDSIDFSYYLKSIYMAVNGSEVHGGDAVAYSPALLQDGKYYISTGDVITASQTSWNPFSHAGQNASSFNRYFNNGSSTEHPNFLATGTAIQFGFATSNTITQGYTAQLITGIDNWEVEIEAQTPSVPGVPEPATMLLLGLGLIGLAAVRRKFVN
jgi:hypothetical protein